MDFENVNPNVYYPSPSMQSDQYSYKPLQNQYDASQYAQFQQNQMNPMGYQMPSYQMPNNNYQMPQNTGVDYNQYNYEAQSGLNGQMVFQNQGYNQMQYEGNPMNYQYSGFASNSFAGVQQQNGFPVGGQQVNVKSQEEEEEKAVDPDFKPEENVEEESEDDDEGYCMKNFIKY